MYFNNRNKFALQFISFYLVFNAINPSLAQNNPVSSALTVKADHSFLTEFKDDLKNISLRWKVTILSEGEPYKLLPEKKLDVSRPEANYPTTIKYLMKRYDFQTILVGKILVLTKKYTDDGDIPEVSMEEAIDCLEKALQNLRCVTHPVPKNSPRFFLKGVTEALTASQLNRLSGDGIPIAELSDASKSIFVTMAEYSTFATYSNLIEQTLERLKSIQKKDAIFHWQKIREKSYFGYSTVNSITNEKAFSTFSGLEQWVSITSSGIPTELKDFTDPDLLDTALPNVPYTEEISDRFIDLLANKNLKHSADARYICANAYSEKRLVTTGLEYSSTLEFVKAAQSILGFRIIKKNNSEYNLTFPVSQLPQNYNELGGSLNKVLPIAFMRYFENKLSQLSKKMNGEGENDSFEFDYGNYREIVNRVAPRQFQLVRKDAEKEVDNSTGKSKPISKMKDRTNKLFLFSLFNPSAGALAWLKMCKIPPCITNFDQVVLTGETGIMVIRDGKYQQKYIKIYLSNINPATGKLEQGLGWERLFYPQTKRE